MAEPFDEPLGVVPRDELTDDPLRLGERLTSHGVIVRPQKFTERSPFSEMKRAAQSSPRRVAHWHRIEN